MKGFPPEMPQGNSPHEEKPQPKEGGVFKMTSMKLSFKSVWKPTSIVLNEASLKNTVASWKCFRMPGFELVFGTHVTSFEIA